MMQVLVNFLHDATAQITNTPLHSRSGHPEAGCWTLPPTSRHCPVDLELADLKGQRVDAGLSLLQHVSAFPIVTEKNFKNHTITN